MNHSFAFFFGWYSARCCIRLRKGFNICHWIRMYNLFVFKPFQSCSSTGSGMVNCGSFKVSKVCKFLQEIFKVLFCKFADSKVLAKERQPVTVHHVVHFFTVVIANRLIMSSFVFNIFRLFRSPEIMQKLTKVHCAFWV